MLINMHPRERCAGDPCCVHNPSDHHMLGWPQNWRVDRHFMERLCPHGIGHPDPDQMSYLYGIMFKDDADAEGMHGCDGCCRPPIVNHNTDDLID